MCDEPSMRYLSCLQSWPTQYHHHNKFYFVFAGRMVDVALYLIMMIKMCGGCCRCNGERSCGDGKRGTLQAITQCIRLDAHIRCGASDS